MYPNRDKAKEILKSADDSRRSQIRDVILRAQAFRGF